MGQLGSAPNATTTVIATGSFSGLLRIYSPRQPGYNVEDLLLEMRMHAPILSVAIGRFVPESRVMALAVLHPRSTAVYKLSSGPDITKDATLFKLAPSFAHPLPWPAFNMVTGTLGCGSGEHEQLCIQSMDGQLLVIDQVRGGCHIPFHALA